jgi:oligogalacturonide lyase
MSSISRCLAIALLLTAPGLPASGLRLTGLTETPARSGSIDSESGQGPTGQGPQKEPSATPPLEWVDPATGHRVIRLSREPGSSSLYFHQNAYTAGGDKMVFTTREGLSAYNFKTRDIEPLVQGRVGDVTVGKKTRLVFYFKGNTVCATDLDTRATWEIIKGDTVHATNLDTHSAQEIPLADLHSGSGFGVNADETLLAGSYVVAPARVVGGQRAAAAQQPANAPPAARGDNYPGKGAMMERRLAEHLPMALYTINIKTGEVNTFNHCTDWLNHVQCSPADPGLIMFCHEGPWHKVDRIWTIRTDGTGLRKIHSRTMDMEIAGHEFFGANGRTIWYDLQTPKGKEFWLAGLVLAAGEKIRYKLARDQWSVHFNVSPDGQLFAGDGGGPSSVAAPGNGQWIYLFTPKDGSLKAEKLVNLASHDYRLEPNVTFTPDGRWIVFRSNMHGPTHVYAVEVNDSHKA